MLDEKLVEREKELTKKCQKCVDSYLKRNPGMPFNYQSCERCNIGREVHNLERNSKWDSAPFATSKWGK